MKKFRIVMIVALVFSLLSAFTAVSAAEPTEDEILAKEYVIEQFSEQGHNNFYYMYLDYADNTFKELTYSETDQQYKGPETGYDFLFIGYNLGYIHPSEVGQPTIAFKCDYSGKIKLHFNFYQVGPQDGSDGTRAIVFKNDANTQVWPTDSNDVVSPAPNGADFEAEIEVKAGDTLYLVIDKRTGIPSDGTAFNSLKYQYVSLASEDDNTSEQPSPDTADFATAVVVCAVVSAGVVLTVAKKNR